MPRSSLKFNDLVEDLVDWYRAVKRDFPWRSAQPDPYFVWISEVMSQQSTMAMVLPFFERWVEAFPRLEDLAASSEERVLARWAGLGYYSRARNVHKAARALVDFRAQNKGQWPTTPEQWRELPGVGPYTAAAVTAICFDHPVIPLDGNVLRVFARLEGVEDPLNSPADRKKVEASLLETSPTIPQRSRGDVAQALMELGATVCRPGNLVLCEACPLSRGCRAFREGRAAAIPRTKVRSEMIARRELAVIYREPQEVGKGRGQRVLLRQIPAGQRLAGQWELPTQQLSTDEAQLESELLQLRGHFGPLWGPIKHTITRYQYKIYGVEAGEWQGPVPPGHAFWAEDAESPLVVTTATRKLLAQAACLGDDG